MTFTSERQKKITLGVLLLTLFGVGSFFYSYQNVGNLPGGNIALSKVLWLGCIIFFWFFAPLLLLLEKGINKTDRWLLQLHMANVWIRGFIELFMMYQYQNWQPTYGISHDILSMIGLLILVVFCRNRLSSFIKYFLIVITMTFFIEACFAQYMLTYVNNENSPVFFVPAGSEHQIILTITWFVLIFLSGYLIYFIKYFLRNKT